MTAKTPQKYYNLFLSSCSDKLSKAQMIRQNINNNITLEQNKILFEKRALDYEHDFSNPKYLHELGFENSDLLSVLHNIFHESLKNAILNRPVFVWNKSDLLIALKEYFEDFDREKLQREFERQFSKVQLNLEDSLMLERSTTINCFNRILHLANPDNLDWMAGYGVYITKVEQEMCKFWYELEKDKLEIVANHIVDAFYHGFLSQSRTIGNRNNVRLVYAIGQEALAQRVVSIFKERGMEPIILMPTSIGYSSNCMADHMYDEASYQKKECYDGKAYAYNMAIDRYREYIKNTCGFVRIGTFGSEVKPAQASKFAYKPSIKTMEMFRDMVAKNRELEAGVLKPDELSFCSIVFPDKRIGDDFEDVFDEFFKLNTEESEPFELIQEKLIEILDKCDKAHLKGMNGNETDLIVSMKTLDHPEGQSKFLNCGGDLNVPHGEIFTTPLLDGTNGVLNVNEIYLRDKYYKNLTLTFENGLITAYSCDNFDDVEKNKNYVFENLLNNTKNVPMGEFAIGTNTLAYKIALKYGLFSKLPILLAEKMGPHIAVGDPCFARGEDSPIFNIHSGKEMIARDNEKTKHRRENKGCYVNFHTDITIPFDEMGEYAGIESKTGKKHFIIKNGKFVPECTRVLNKNLE